MPDYPITLCERSAATERLINQYVDDLKKDAHTIGRHGLTEAQFRASGLFKSAVEKIRGTQAASMGVKRDFMASVLAYMESNGFIDDWEFTGSGERHDYQVGMDSGRVCIMETKGCLDGNNTNIFERPPNADEFLIWSLCQNPGADPRHNAWSGTHTRLGAEIIHRKQKVDALVIWDMFCGTALRACPKLAADPARGTVVDGVTLPPPCVYLFPRSIPDPRSNQNPPCWQRTDVHIIDALLNAFKGNDDDIVSVKIEARMQDAHVQRKTHFIRNGVEFARSRWTTIKRAN